MRKALLPAIAVLLNLVACGNTALRPPPARQDSPLDNVISAFSSCNASYFRELTNDREIWKAYAPLETKGEFSRILVQDRNVDGLDTVALQGQPSVQGIRLLSYFDEISDLGSLGIYHYWGFIADGSVEQVANRLQVLVKDRDRLRKNGSTFVRTEIKGQQTRWIPVALKSGTVPKVGLVERVLLIEPEGDNKVRFSCSLQGSVNAELLKVERPDIDTADYPKQLSPTLFKDTPVPPSVMQTAQQAASQTLLTPKFHRLSYSYSIAGNHGAKPSNISVNVENQNGILAVRETYDPSFSVDRLLVGGIIQLKSRMNGLSDGRVWITTDLNVDTSMKLDIGAVWRVDGKGQITPARADEKLHNIARRCEVKRVIEAQKVHANLNGPAHIISCTFGDDSKPREQVFISELGYVVDIPSALSDLDKNKGLIFTSFEVER